MIVFKAVSSFMFPENPGTSGMTMTTLNLLSDLAAIMILFTRACAMRFFTGPFLTVFEMLPWRKLSKVVLGDNSQELIL